MAASNRGVVYMGPGQVAVHSIDYPELALGSRRCEHGAILISQRGSNEQPGGRDASAGTVPSIVRRGRQRSVRKVGTEFMSPRVYGCWASWMMTFAGPDSTTRPAYITMRRSVVWDTIARS